jgi:hypothetical protein
MPDPHPLDFDWRFTRETVAHLVAITANAKRILVVGAPSVAAELSRIGRVFVCIDRQPCYLPMLAGQYHSLDLRYDAIRTLNLGLFDAAILDPPWYPDDARIWITQVLPLIESAGSIFFSMWPSDVRDGAVAERIKLTELANEFGSVEINNNKLRYITPLFETASAENLGKTISSDWRRGALATLIVKDAATAKEFNPLPRPRIVWERFVFDRYQLALRRPATASIEQVALHKVAQRWTLPDVSRRNPLRSEIDLWTSTNLVARTGNPLSFLDALAAVCEGVRPKHSHARRALALLSATGFISSRYCYPRAQRWRHFD